MTCAFYSSSDEERIMEDVIRICGFLEDRSYKKGKGTHTPEVVVPRIDTL